MATLVKWMYRGWKGAYPKWISRYLDYEAITIVCFLVFFSVFMLKNGLVQTIIKVMLVFCIFLIKVHIPLMGCDFWNALLWWPYGSVYIYLEQITLDYKWDFTNRGASNKIDTGWLHLSTWCGSLRLMTPFPTYL